MGVKRKVLPLKFIVGLIVALLVISGCQPGEGGGTEPTATPTTLPTCAAADMAAPALTSPVAGEVVSTSLPIFEWSFPAPCVPESYRVDLSVTADFSDTSLSGGTGNPSTSWMPGPELDDCTIYYWQVAGFSEGELGPFSETRSFSTDFEGICTFEPTAVPTIVPTEVPTEESGGTCPGEDLVAPLLSSPADGSTVGELWPTLEWSYPGDCDPEGYRIDLAVDPSFADTSLSGGTGNPSTDWAPGDELDPATTYYWRVAGITGTDLGPFSDTWSFTTPSATTGGEPESGDTGGDTGSEPESGEPEPEATDPAACLIAPEQTAPANGSTISELWPSLQWRYLPTDCVPDRYIIHLDTDPAFSSDALNGGTSGPSTSWAPGHELEPDTVYYWRVGSVREDYFGEWSATWSFRTPPPEPEVCAMNAPTLDSPADGAMVYDDWPTLDWSYKGDCEPEGYRIDLATDPSFADTSLSGGTGNPSTRWAPGDPLDDCETYYWRVAGIIDTTLGPWSETWSFRVNDSRKCVWR